MGLFGEEAPCQMTAWRSDEMSNWQANSDHLLPFILRS
jgi:hypothetical protein